jgi:hypothetical protein
VGSTCQWKRAWRRSTSKSSTTPPQHLLTPTSPGVSAAKESSTGPTAHPSTSTSPPCAKPASHRAAAPPRSCTPCTSTASSSTTCPSSKNSRISASWSAATIASMPGFARREVRRVARSSGRHGQACLMPRARWSTVPMLTYPLPMARCPRNQSDLATTPSPLFRPLRAASRQSALRLETRQMVLLATFYTRWVVGFLVLRAELLGVGVLIWWLYSYWMCG